MNFYYPRRHHGELGGTVKKWCFSLPLMPKGTAWSISSTVIQKKKGGERLPSTNNLYKSSFFNLLPTFPIWTRSHRCKEQQLDHSANNFVSQNVCKILLLRISGPHGHRCYQ